MNSRILIILIILITIGVGGFFVYKYLLVEKEEGPIDRVNQNIPPYLLYQSKSQEIPEEYLLVENQKLDTELIYQKTRRLEFTGKNKLYCKLSGEEAEKIEYFYHSLGPDWEGGWYYRDAYICGDNYWILDADGRFGTKIYGPFEKEGVSEAEKEQMSPCSWVFKTKKDYYNLVYGFVYDDRSKFATLPSANLKVRPDKLNNGYFAISHGCSPDYLKYPYVNPCNFVFCNITYEEWARIRMGEPEAGKSWDDFLTPSIIDEPFEEFYFCGEDSPFFGVLSIEELNEIIDNNELSTRCEKIF